MPLMNESSMMQFTQLQRKRIAGTKAHTFSPIPWVLTRLCLMTCVIGPCLSPDLAPAKESVTTETDGPATDSRPNIVVVIADDWSWPHASVLGAKAVATPHFDRIANEGTLFKNAFVSAPSCTPSRLSILTGESETVLF